MKLFFSSSLGAIFMLMAFCAGAQTPVGEDTLQGEYWWQNNEKWIATGFAGFGEVADSANDFLPAAGVGARFVISQKHRVSLSFDYAIGKNGGEFYVGVGEVF